jgi:hypothetical protein
MRNLNILLISLCVGFATQALADDAPVADSTPAADAAKPDAKAAALAEQTKRLRSMGYSPETHRGVTVFCRSEKTIGSNFERKTCRNGDDIERDAQAAKDSLQGSRTTR